MYINGHSTHIFHPSWGIAYDLPARKDRYPSLYSFLTYCFFYICPSNPVLPLSTLASELYTTKLTGYYPRTKVHRCWASACHNSGQPYNTSICWEIKQYMKQFHIQYEWSIDCIHQNGSHSYFIDGNFIQFIHIIHINLLVFTLDLYLILIYYK